MIVNSYQINDSLQLEPFPIEGTEFKAGNDDKKIWIDLTDPTAEGIEKWLNSHGITGLTKQLCLEGRDRPGFYPLKNETLLVIPILLRDKDENKYSNKVNYITFLCRDNVLLSIHNKPLLASNIKSISETSESWIPAQTLAGLMSALMIYISQEFLNHSIQLRNDIFALEQRMSHKPELVKATEILSLRADLIALGTVVSDQLPPLQAMTNIRKDFLHAGGAEEYMNCALVNLQAVNSSLDWLDGRISALLSGFDMHAQNRTNRRLNMLTILSAIFNPATLLAGIWGMNFVKMPLLANDFGYYIAIGSMVGIGLLMFLFFRRGGWFD